MSTPEKVFFLDRYSSTFCLCSSGLKTNKHLITFSAETAMPEKLCLLEEKEVQLEKRKDIVKHRHCG